MNVLSHNFFKGLLILVPIVATIYTVYRVFLFIDGLLQIQLPDMEKPIPGVGFVVTIAIITLIGTFASNFFVKKLFDLTDRLFARLPLLKILYNSIKDLIGAFVGEKKQFDKPVIVTISPESNMKVIGFITRDSLDFLGIDDHVAVYIPQSYNFAGNLFLFPKAQVQPLSQDSSNVLTFLISGGISGIGNANAGKQIETR
ncbi:MAG: DUF502 domain-containing protein [Candidatus Omnitrophota bacterium]|jgi:uncharacterized membrane protein|nr:MAG: DUF502 domain-containing protein [Candidatus Omnitrophota bacterium]